MYTYGSIKSKEQDLAFNGCCHRVPKIRYCASFEVSIVLRQLDSRYLFRVPYITFAKSAKAAFSSYNSRGASGLQVREHL